MNIRKKPNLIFFNFDFIYSGFKLKDIIFSYKRHNIKINSRFSTFLFIVKLYVSFMYESTSLNLREDLSILKLISVPKMNYLTNARHGVPFA